MSRPASQEPQPEAGLACRACGCRHLGVVYTRHVHNGIRRCRECRNCGRRMLTFEETTHANVRRP